MEPMEQHGAAVGHRPAWLGRTGGTHAQAATRHVGLQAITPAGAAADAAVVGLGFSGVSTAVQLLETMAAGSRLALVEPAPQPGRGLAYGTRVASHLMNVRAAKLGLSPDREGDFLAWLRGQHEPVDAADFVPRQRFGDYLQARLAQAIAARPDLRVDWYRDTVRSLGGEAGRGFTLVLGGGQTLACARVVLALGHAPSPPPHADLAACPPAHYVHQPFAAPGALHGLTGDEAVLLLGSGLTAIDMLADLAERGHRGPVHMLSRHGLLPRPHRVAAPVPAARFTGWLQQGTPTVRRLLSQWRAELASAQAEGRDWRDLVAGIRDATPALWHALPLAERRRFLRHLARYWDVHRHGCPPHSHALVERWRASGQLRCIEGRLSSVVVRAGALDVGWRPRGAALDQRLSVQRIVNCTGGSSARDLSAWPLLASIAHQQGLLRCPLGLGVLVDDHGRLLDAFARPLAGLYYVGPLLKAQHWEAIAVPELRQHAARVARHIAAG